MDGKYALIWYHRLLFFAPNLVHVFNYYFWLTQVIQSTLYLCISITFWFNVDIVQLGFNIAIRPGPSCELWYRYTFTDNGSRLVWKCQPGPFSILKTIRDRSKERRWIGILTQDANKGINHIENSLLCLSTTSHWEINFKFAMIIHRKWPFIVIIRIGVIGLWVY